jgi:hypothetical protein
LDDLGKSVDIIATTLKRKLFAQIIDRTTPVEYREVKPYWTSMLKRVQVSFRLVLRSGMTPPIPVLAVCIDKVPQSNCWPPWTRCSPIRTFIAKAAFWSAGCSWILTRSLATYLLVVGICLVGAQHASAASMTLSQELDGILGKLRTNVSADQYRQIDDAIKSSPSLIEELNRLAASGKLTEIVVLTSAATSNAPAPGRFRAWVTDTSIVLTESLLSQLTKNREYDVVFPDDILPNNTTFVLGHLAFHLDAGKILAKPGDVPHLNDYIAAMLNQEARAYIHAWNDALEAAVQQNNDKRLTPRQIANFMFNLHYRFAFLKALGQPTDKIHLEQNGVIDDGDSNARAIVAALKDSPIADIQ